MKKIFVFLLIAASIGCSSSKTEQNSDLISPKAEEVTKKPLEVRVEVVCIDRVTKDGKPVFDKDGKRAQDCKTMKVREKLQTKPPERK